MPPTRRREYGTGSIYQRKDGRWCGSLMRERVRYPPVYGRTRREVAVKLAALLRQIEAGIQVHTHQTLGQFLTTWLDTEVAVNPDTKPGTLRAYRYRAGLVARQIGSVQLAKVTPQHVQSVQAALLAAGRAPASVRDVINLLGIALNAAERWQLIQRSPVRGVRRVRSTSPKKPGMGVTEAHAVLEAVAGHRYAVAAALGLYAGVRVSEALGVRWSDLDGDWLTIARQLQQVTRATRGDGPALAEVPTKSRAVRRVPVTPQLRAALDAQRAHQATAREAAGERWQESGYVLTNARGGPVYQVMISAMLKERLAGDLAVYTFHAFRHGYSAILHAAGVDLETRMALLGHKTMEMTAGVYGHVAERTLHAAGERLSEAMRG